LEERKKKSRHPHFSLLIFQSWGKITLECQEKEVVIAIDIEGKMPEGIGRSRAGGILFSFKLAFQSLFCLNSNIELGPFSSADRLSSA
jgi:hypothetical protein